MTTPLKNLICIESIGIYYRCLFLAHLLFVMTKISLWTTLTGLSASAAAFSSASDFQQLYKRTGSVLFDEVSITIFE